LIDHILKHRLNCLEAKALSKLTKGAKPEKVGDFLYFFSIGSYTKKWLFWKETVFPKRQVMTQVCGHSCPLVIWWAYIMRFFQSLLVGIRLLLLCREN